MTEKDSIEKLHPLEIRILSSFEEDEAISHAEALSRLPLNTGQYNQAITWLESKHLIEQRSQEKRNIYSLTDTGKVYKSEGTPEERMVDLLRKEGPLTIPEVTEKLGLEKSDIGSAFGSLSKESCVSMDQSKKVQILSETLPERCVVLRGLLDGIPVEGELPDGDVSEGERAVLEANSRKRGTSKGIFRVVERQTKSYALTRAGAAAKSLLKERGITGEEIGPVTPELLRSGSWKGKSFRPYNTEIPPQRVLLGRKNPYMEFLEELKNKLVSLGFEEFDGPLIEPDFWNADALYMPQFHSARDIHDVYYIKDPKHTERIEEPYLEQVASTHENGWKTGSRGWGYTFDKQRTRRLVLRSQGTVLSAKQLRNAKVPGKYFGVVRCFRYDQVDATHLADFYQTEGIVLGEHVNLKTLLGLLKMFAVEVAKAQEVKYVPGYFPFTEPSVEVHIKHPELGWFELGGSGIFRPEVTLPLGISVPVLAWGLGIDRMALMSLGLSDIRDLFSNDIERVRLSRRS